VPDEARELGRALIFLGLGLLTWAIATAVDEWLTRRRGPDA
jgi:hypothetical protein